MSMNDLLVKERAENAQLRAQVAELEQQVEILCQRPEFDLSTVHGREQAVITNMKKSFEEGVA